MCREFYSIGKDEEGKKYLEYHGFFWSRDNGGEERDPETGELLDYAFTNGKIDWIYLDEMRGDPYAFVMSKFDVCQQYQEDISEGTHYIRSNNFYGTGDNGKRLHMSDVDINAPCGDYFFDSETDKPRFTYVSGKTYAAYTDAWDDISCRFLKRFLASELPECEIDYDSVEFFESYCELTREFLIPTLERFGYNVRPDGTDF